MGAKTNRGLNNGCVAIAMDKLHDLAKRCAEELPCLGMYITQLVKGQGLSQHRDYHNH